MNKQKIILGFMKIIDERILEHMLEYNVKRACVTVKSLEHYINCKVEVVRLVNSSRDRKQLIENIVEINRGLVTDSSLQKLSYKLYCYVKNSV